jgi:hypothetical protein
MMSKTNRTSIIGVTLISELRPSRDPLIMDIDVLLGFTGAAMAADDWIARAR